MKIRTPEERQEFCKQLEALWAGLEDLRFGKFLYRAIENEEGSIHFLYYLEDEKFLEILYDYYHNPDKGTHAKDLEKEHK